MPWERRRYSHSVTSPARALAWEFASRHRWGLAAVGGYLVLLYAVKLLVLGPWRRPALESELEFALLVIVPLASTFTYFLATFSHGLEGDIAGRRSLYPQRLLRLPLSSRALAGWPMLYGCVAVVLLWLLTRAFGLWPRDVSVPTLWPGALAAVILAWTQVLTWAPLAVRGLRIGLAVFWLGSFALGAVLGLHLKLGEGFMMLILLPQLPLAFYAAATAVGAARRGSSSIWGATPTRDRRPSERGPDFRTPARAQLWLEWQRFGRSLPLLAALTLPLELLMIVVFADTPSVVRATSIVVLFSPPFLATFVAATVRRSSDSHEQPHQLSPFLARRPMKTSGLVSARLKAAALSVLVTWCLVGVGLPTSLYLTGNGGLMVNFTSTLVTILAPPRAMVAGGTRRLRSPGPDLDAAHSEPAHRTQRSPLASQGKPVWNARTLDPGGPRRALGSHQSRGLGVGLADPASCSDHHRDPASPEQLVGPRQASRKAPGLGADAADHRYSVDRNGACPLCTPRLARAKCSFSSLPAADAGDRGCPDRAAGRRTTRPPLESPQMRRQLTEAR